MADDIRKKTSLRKMKLIATSLLGLMTSLFLVAHYFEKTVPGIDFLRAFAEAAMVGAFADWFAVVALFGHPLGLKLPHTAIIPRNKDRIGEGLGAFVQENFLTPEAISEKVRSADIAGAAAEWLSHPGNTERVADEVKALLPKMLDALGDEEVSDFIRDKAVLAVKSTDLVSLAGDFLELLTTHDRHQMLFDQALMLIKDLFEKYKPHIQSRITRESNVFLVLLGGDTALYNKLVTVVTRTLDEVASNPNHELRKRYSEVMQDFITKLKTSPEYGAKVDEIREDVFNSPAVLRYFENVWSDIKIAVLADLSLPESVIRERTKEAILRVSMGALSDAYVRDRLNNWIRNALVDTLSRHREEISKLIADKVKEWDAWTVSRKLELEVGKDLQFVRINGTVIGGAVGLLIHAVSRLF